MGFFKEVKQALRDQMRSMRGDHPQPPKRNTPPSSPKKSSPKKSSAKKPPAQVVRVEYLNAYRGPANPTREVSGGYGYYWRIQTPPRLGMRVLAPVHSGYWEEAVVIGFGRDGYSGRLKSITRTAR